MGSDYFEHKLIKPNSIELRDYQTNIVNVYMKYVDRPICENEDAFPGYGGILEVPCGRGKTVMALKIISLIQKKTHTQKTEGRQKLELILFMPRRKEIKFIWIQNSPTQLDKQRCT